MSFSIKRAMVALSLGAATLTGLAATPTLAQPGRADREYRRDVRDARKDYRREVRDARQDYRRDVREDRRDWRDDRRDDRRNWRNYDWNRPDPRYGRAYRPDRYYTAGAPIRVDRRTRIYRGQDNRYYCRRQDGTTGLIVGAALGGLLGNQIAVGQSNILGTLIGGGAGALLGREIDRGGVSCR